MLTLVVERTPDPSFNDELVAVARFCQKRLWERSGILAPLVPQAYLETHRNHSDERGTTLAKSQILCFGRLGTEEQGVLRAGSEPSAFSVDRVSYSIRASSADALRLVYAVEPCFGEAREGPETWRVPSAITFMSGSEMPTSSAVT